jgi:hypothetical protein
MSSNVYTNAIIREKFEILQQRNKNIRQKTAIV